MIPFYVMVGAILVTRAVGLIVPGVDGWQDATRIGLAVMFLFTATAHFDRTRPDLIRMVPPGLPRPDLLVTLTGIAEYAGAVGLLIPATARFAAAGLIVLLVAMFPANIFAARHQHTIRGKAHTPLVFRLPLQMLWIVLLWWSVP